MLFNDVNFFDPDFIWAALVICKLKENYIFNPLWWNIVARAEYRTHFLTKIFGGAYRGCYFLAFCIFVLGIYRDKMFDVAVARQPQSSLLAHEGFSLLAAVLFAAGGIFVLASYWKLGITGTYLGDYFGILMEKRVTGFPFNVMNNPMYNGSTMLFLAHALWNKSIAGVWLSVVVYVVYWVACVFENSFTTMIYTNASKNKNSAKKK